MIKNRVEKTDLNELEFQVLRRQKNPGNLVSLWKKQLITDLLKFQLCFSRNYGHGPQWRRAIWNRIDTFCFKAAIIIVDTSVSH